MRDCSWFGLLSSSLPVWQWKVISFGVSSMFPFKVENLHCHLTLREYLHILGCCSSFKLNITVGIGVLFQLRRVNIPWLYLWTMVTPKSSAHLFLKCCRKVKDSPISLVLNDTSRTSGPDSEAGGCADGGAALNQLHRYLCMSVFETGEYLKIAMLMGTNWYNSRRYSNVGGHKLMHQWL